MRAGRLKGAHHDGRRALLTVGTCQAASCDDAHSNATHACGTYRTCTHADVSRDVFAGQDKRKERSVEWMDG